MTTPPYNPDPIEELCERWQSRRTITGEILDLSIPAIRALQERVKLLEFELTESNRLLLLDLKQINALRAKIKRLMEAGKHAIENIASFEAREAWRKAVSE